MNLTDVLHLDYLLQFSNKTILVYIYKKYQIIHILHAFAFEMGFHAKGMENDKQERNNYMRNNELISILKVCDRILDLALIVDRSGSIHERFAWNVAFNEYGYGWKLLTSFLVNLMYRLHIGPTQTRVRKFIIVRLPIFLNTKLTYPLNYFIIRYKYTLF